MCSSDLYYAWARLNRDHLMPTHAQLREAERITDAWIDRDERKGKGASDHAPVIVELL